MSALKPSFHCRIYGHQWNPQTAEYFNELDCERCGYHQSCFDAEPPYLFRHWHRFRHWWQWRRGKLRWQIRDLARFFRRLIGRRHPDDDIPF